MVLVGLLVQAAFGLPAALSMAASAAPVCSTVHAAGATGGPALPAHDHAHCPLCQAGAGPPLAASAVPVPLPLPAHWSAPEQGVVHLVLRRATTAYSSRAPPALA